MPYPLPPPEPAAIVEVAREAQPGLSIPAPVIDETIVEQQHLFPSPFLSPPAPSAPEAEDLFLPFVALAAPESADRLTTATVSAQALGNSLGLHRSPRVAATYPPSIPTLSDRSGGNGATAPLFSPPARNTLAQSDASASDAAPGTTATEGDNAIPPAIAYPPGAQPDPRWSNGGVTGEGQLLTPTSPTSRPPIPLNLTADYQEFDPERQVVTARGNVLLRVGNGLLNADRLWVNLTNRYVLAEGNVILRRGDQLIQGERAEYNLLQGAGVIYGAYGELFTPTTGEDFANILPPDTSARANQPISDRLRDRGPIRGITSPGGVLLATDDVGVAGTEGGVVRRLRFEAEEIRFNADGWTTGAIRFTNDPFSPPELEFRGDSARLVSLNENEDELHIENLRIVFDQGFTIPLLRSRILLSRGTLDDEALNPLPTGIGIDGRDRDGLFVERTFSVAVVPPWTLEVTPQFFVERWLDNSEFADLANYGVVFDLNGELGPATSATATASIAGLDLQNLDDRLRASVRVRQQLSFHTLNLEGSYRDRLFNGSLGFQDVQSSIGAVLVSPDIVLGDTGINLRYQLSGQVVTAETDRISLLPSNPVNSFLSLGRAQGNILLTRTFPIWQGEARPATLEEGLRFSPTPVVPYFNFILGGQGTLTYYSSGDTQENVTAIVGLQGQVGHFVNDFFDYTQFNITYAKAFVGDGESPFLFDRDIDRNVLSFGLIQQIYGPIRAGFQASVNLDTGDFFSIDYVLEYSRRAYGLVIRFNPEQSTGFIGFRISDFDWSGRAASFGGAEIRGVERGVVQ
ncbi:MAG: DUF3769 domain-containing protein [Cyanobacteria bacterium]|nr:DUF3769 domain-containing protein [Cyanobacteriota bacterium]